MNDIQIFDYADEVIRTAFSDEGEPLVCAADLARAVGLKSPERAYSRIDPDHKVMLKTQTLGGGQEMTYLTESGAYEFLVGLRLKANSPHQDRIKKFRKWVFEDVLPTIRRTGGYSAHPVETEAVKLAPIMDEIEANIRLARLLGLSENQALLAARNRILRVLQFDIQSEFQLSLPSPGNKVQRIVTEVAAVVYERVGVKLSAMAINQRLADAGWQVKQPSGKGWEPTLMGKENGGLLLDVAKAKGIGKPVQMTVWIGDDVVEFLCDPSVANNAA